MIKLKQEMKEQLLNLKDEDLDVVSTIFQKKYFVDLELARVLVVHNVTLDSDDKNLFEYCVYLNGIENKDEGHQLLCEYQDFRYFQGDDANDEIGGIAIFTNIDSFVEFIYDYFYHDEFLNFGDDY